MQTIPDSAISDTAGQVTAFAFATFICERCTAPLLSSKRASSSGSTVYALICRIPAMLSCSSEFNSLEASFASW